MNIVCRIKNLLAPEISDLQKLEIQHKRLYQKRMMQQHRGRVTKQIDAELNQVNAHINAIYAKRNAAIQQEDSLLQNAYAEIDEEFPNLMSWIKRDRN